MKSEQFINRRKSLGYSQTALAKALGLSVRQISGMETGARTISKVIALAMHALKEKKS